MNRLIYPFILIVFWLIVLSYIFKSSLPVVSDLTYENKATLFNFVPQGWGFFTRDPREDELILFEIKNNSIERFTKTNSAISSFFGVSRKNRLINVESGILLPEIEDSLWKSMKGRELILDKTLKTDTIINRFHPCNIKGDFFFVKQERIPWAWAGNKIIMPYKYVKVHIIAD